MSIHTWYKYLEYASESVSGRCFRKREWFSGEIENTLFSKMANRFRKRERYRFRKRELPLILAQEKSTLAACLCLDLRRVSPWGLRRLIAIMSTSNHRNSLIFNNFQKWENNYRSGKIISPITRFSSHFASKGWGLIPEGGFLWGTFPIFIKAVSGCGLRFQRVSNG